MLFRLAWRGMTELSPSIMYKVAYLYAWKGMRAVSAYKKRIKKGELYPPFMFVALTNTCNLRCHGCWVEKEGRARHLPAEDLDALIESGKKQKAHYYTLLGGEPFMYPGIWDVFRRHSDCYFQIITNGMMFTEKNVKRLRQLGNVTPLISLDGFQEQNDLRRGEGVWEKVDVGLDLLKKNKIFFGIATTATGKNLEEVLSDEFLQHFINKGAMYIWYYIYRPVGDDPHTEYCMTEEQIIESRRRMLALRKKHPILIIDTYWTADGEAFCPAASGLGFHIGPEGSIEICPPLSFATDLIRDNGGDVAKTLKDSKYLNGFHKFVTDRTKGCVILENPQELVEYIQGHGAKDYSTRDAFAEIASGTPRHSHHLPGQEIPEDYWFYRFLKKQVFFGMGAMG
jgi:MoaA/NifB/PqqE/SkfB family radical SAM enzyme